MVSVAIVIAASLASLIVGGVIGVALICMVRINNNEDKEN